MAIVKDQLVSWYIKNLMVPGTDKIDSPGFIMSEFKEQGERVSVRQVALSESLLAEFESRVVCEYGEPGKQMMYTLGKRVGYAYGQLSKCDRMGDTPKDKFMHFIDFILLYVGCVWSGGIQHKVDLETKVLELELKDYVICRKNGHGYLLTSGGIAGIWAYMTLDKSIEGIQIACQGRGDKVCKLICAPSAYFEKQGMKYMKGPELNEIQTSQELKAINAIKATKYSRKSLKNLMDAGIFQYKGGQIIYNDERYVLFETYLIYLLEETICSNEKLEKLLFSTAFGYAKDLIGLNPNLKSLGFIMEFLGATGWGDVLVTASAGKYNAAVMSFPWANFQNPKLILFRGLLSGFLSGLSNKEIILENYSPQLTHDGFNITCSTK